jgi:hypothetical protein
MDADLLSRPTPPSVDRSAFGATLWLYSIQAVLLSAYVALSFLLPARVTWLSAAAHVAAMHGLLFFTIALCWGGIRTFDFSRVPSYFPLTPRLAEAPSVIVIIGNAALLVCLAVEDWVQRETSLLDFSVLGVVQALGVIELCIVGASSLVVAWRFVQYAKLRGGDTGVGNFSLQLGGENEDWLPTVMPLGGGIATQEVRNDT